MVSVVGFARSQVEDVISEVKLDKAKPNTHHFVVSVLQNEVTLFSILCNSIGRIWICSNPNVFTETLHGHVFSDHQPQIFVSSVGFSDVVRFFLPFHKVLTLFHIYV